MDLNNRYQYQHQIPIIYGLDWAHAPALAQLRGRQDAAPALGEGQGQGLIQLLVLVLVLVLIYGF